MKKLPGLILIFTSLIFFGCTHDELDIPSQCGKECQVVEEFVNVTAKVVQWPITCEFVLTTDSMTLLLRGRGDLDSTNTFLPCGGLPPELMVNDTLVIVSGFRYNCCDEFAPNGNSSWQGTGCRFEFTSIEAAPIQLQVKDAPACDDGCEISEELIRITAKVFQWGPTCEYVLETDSTLIADGGYLSIEHFRTQKVLVPCNSLPSKYKLNQLLVTVSGYKYKCCMELELPYVDPGFGCRFEITGIEPIN